MLTCFVAKTDDATAVRQADAEALPFEDESFHLYTIAFGLRNVTDVRIVHLSFVIHYASSSGVIEGFFFVPSLFHVGQVHAASGEGYVARVIADRTRWEFFAWAHTTIVSSPNTIGPGTTSPVLHIGMIAVVGEMLCASGSIVLTMYGVKGNVAALVWSSCDIVRGHNSCRVIAGRLIFRSTCHVEVSCFCNRRA